MTRSSWFLPTGGESRSLAGGVHGTRVGDPGAPAAGPRPPSPAHPDEADAFAEGVAPLLRTEGTS